MNCPVCGIDIGDPVDINSTFWKHLDGCYVDTGNRNGPMECGACGQTFAWGHSMGDTYKNFDVACREFIKHISTADHNWRSYIVKRSMESF